MKEFLSISEFSKLSGIESTTLRYWDDIGLFVPAKRDDNNGYRMYTPEQIITVNFITVLSGLDISLKTIGDVAKIRTPENVIELIEGQEKKLDAEIRRLGERYAVMRARRELIKYGMQVEDLSEIRVLDLDRMQFVRGKRNQFKPDEEFYRPFMKFCEEAKDLRINLQLPISAMHDNWEGFEKAPGRPDYWISIDQTGNFERPVGKYVVGFIRGYYGQFGDLPTRMSEFIKKNHLTVSGPVFEIYLLDEVCIKNPSEYLSCVCVEIN